MSNVIEPQEQCSRRQPPRSNSVSTESTVSSSVAVSDLRRNVGSHPNLPMSLPQLISQNQFNACNDVTIGDNITNVYHSYIVNAATNAVNNPALVLSNQNIPAKEKASYVLKQPWLWSNVILICFCSFTVYIITKTLSDMKSSMVMFPLVNDWRIEVFNDTTLVFRARRSLGIIVSDTADEKQSCNRTEDCISRIRKIEAATMRKISYNFLIGDDDNVYEGLGYNYQGDAASTQFGSSYDDIAISVAFIGTYDDQSPSEGQIKTFQKFSDDAVKRDYLSAEHKIFVRDQLVPNDNPAIGLTAAISKLDNFQDVLQIHFRSSWEAKDPIKPKFLVRLHHPIKTVLLIDSGANSTCDSLESCSPIIQQLQLRDKSLGLNDIQYNFLVSDNGDIYEGRGWDFNTDELEEFFDFDNYLVIGYISDTNKSDPKIETFLSDGIALGKLDKIFDLRVSSDRYDETRYQSFVSREELKALTFEYGLRLSQPVDRIITFGLVLNSTYDDSSDESVRILQTLQTETEDFSFNFYVFDDGKVYEGRGFSSQGDPSYSLYNDIGILFAFFVRDKVTYRPTQNQIKTFLSFLRKSVLKNDTTDDFLILPYAGLLTELQKQPRTPWENIHVLSPTFERQWPLSKNVSKTVEPGALIRNVVLVKITATSYCASLFECAKVVYNLGQSYFYQNNESLPYSYIITDSGHAIEVQGFNRPFLSELFGYNLKIGFLTQNNTVDESSPILIKLFEDGKVLKRLENNLTIELEAEIEVDWTGIGLGCPIPKTELGANRTEMKLQRVLVSSIYDGHNESCYNIDDCFLRINDIIAGSWKPFHVYIGADGNHYFCRNNQGLEFEGTLTFMFIGDYYNASPSQVQMDTLYTLLKRATVVFNGNLSTPYKRFSSLDFRGVIKDPSWFPYSKISF